MICWLFPREYSDFAGLGQPLNDLGFIVSIMDASLPELSGVAVLFPVVVPVSPAVCPETKHIHLEEIDKWVLESKSVITHVSVEDDYNATIISAWRKDLQYVVIMWKPREKEKHWPHHRHEGQRKALACQWRGSAHDVGSSGRGCI